MAIESLAQQTSAFVDALSIKPSPTDKTADENAQEAKTPVQGDTVTISEEARALIAAENPGDSQSSQSGEDTKMEETIRLLKEQIEKLEEELEELENKNMPEKEKLTQIQEKEARLMELRDQLLKAQQTKLKLDGQTEGGGTRARGFGNTAESF